MMLKSGIKLEYHEDGIYFDIIMQFLNYIQQLPEKQVSPKDFRTMFDDFNEKMEKLFTSVYSRKWTENNLYDLFVSENWTL